MIQKRVKLSQLLQQNTKYYYTFVFNYAFIFVGLLGVAMEFQDTATDFDFRTRNDKLIPIMIKRLKTCQIEAKEQRANQSQAFKRPFSMFSKNMSPSKSPSRRLSIENDENLVKSAQAINPPFFPASPNYPNLSNGDLSNRYDFIMLYQILIIQYQVELVKTHLNSS